METKFVKENRYLVLRWDDLHAVLTSYDRSVLEDIIDDVREYRIKHNKEPDPTFVCIKDTYPEYEMVWAAIEKRMKGQQETDDPVV